MEKPSKIGKRFFHPLCGADLLTLHRVFKGAGFIPKANRTQAACIFASAALRAPFNYLERAVFSQETGKVGRDRISLEPHIFILGHWRTGTTHLYNVMAKASQFGFVTPIATGMPWELLTLGRWLKPILDKALPSDRLIDNVPVKPDSPQEDELALANMSALSYYHALYFPKHFNELFYQGVFFDGCTEKEIHAWQECLLRLLCKISVHQHGKQLVLKNPVYTARLRMLSEMFPNAKFIHIYRNPYRVFDSMKNFYDKLLPAVSLQGYGHVDTTEVVLTTYERMMDLLIRDSKAIDQGRFVDICFETFEENPLGELQRAFETVGLADFETTKPDFEHYLESIKDYKKNEYQYSEESVRVVSDRWRRFLDHWGYEEPPTNKVAS